MQEYQKATHITCFDAEYRSVCSQMEQACSVEDAGTARNERGEHKNRFESEKIISNLQTTRAIHCIYSKNHFLVQRSQIQIAPWDT